MPTQKKKKPAWDDSRCKVVETPAHKFYVVCDNEPWRSLGADITGEINIYDSAEDAKEAFEEDAAKRGIKPKK